MKTVLSRGIALLAVLVASVVIAPIAASTAFGASPAVAVEAVKAPLGAKPWEPDVSRPGPVTVPGTGRTVTPFSSPLTETGPKALAGQDKAKGNALDPVRARAAGTAVRRAGGPDDPVNQLSCTEAINRGTSVDPNPDNYTATVSYTASLGCNFYLYYAYGAAAIVDRSSGFDGRFLQISGPFQQYQTFSGALSGSVTVPADLYDGFREAEVVFELYLVTPNGIPWVACNPLPGLRYLACDGLGTDVLHVYVGTGVFSTGLNRPVIRYTALGDSYSSGTGGAPYLFPAACRRTNTSYSRLIAGQFLDGIQIDQPRARACHGAKVLDLYGGYVEPTSQLYDVKPFTRLVTLTAGGNDLGFATKFRQCVLGTCPNPLVTSDELEKLREGLRQLYTKIRGSMRADGRLFVLGYPVILPNPNDYPIDVEPNLLACFGTNATITSNELRRVRDATVLANSYIAAAVADAREYSGDPNMFYVETTGSFLGHRVCSADPYSTGIQVSDPQDSFHPNPRGHQALANALTTTMILNS